MKNIYANRTLRMVLDNGKTTQRHILWFESLEFFMRLTGGKVSECIYDKSGKLIRVEDHKIVDIKEICND